MEYHVISQGSMVWNGYSIPIPYIPYQWSFHTNSHSIPAAVPYQFHTHQFHTYQFHTNGHSIPTVIPYQWLFHTNGLVWNAYSIPIPYQWSFHTNSIPMVIPSQWLFHTNVIPWYLLFHTNGHTSSCCGKRTIPLIYNDTRVQSVDIDTSHLLTNYGVPPSK